MFILARRLLIGAAILLLVVATSSFAGEIVLKTIAPEPNLAWSVIGEIYVELTVNEPTEDGLYQKFHTVRELWIAPESGTVLITWYHPGVKITGGGDAESDNLGFRLKLNDDSGLLPAHGLINNIARFSGGGFPYQPIINTFIVERGSSYDIKLMYFAEGFTDCTAQLLNDAASGMQSIIKVEYLDF